MKNTENIYVETLENDLNSTLESMTADAVWLASFLEVLTTNKEVTIAHLSQLEDIVMGWGGYLEKDCPLCCQTPDICNCEAFEL